MKMTGSVLVVLVSLVLLSGVALADCESDCDGPFQTCVRICRQTTKEDSKEAARCMDNCFRGVSGCQKRCKDKKSENAASVLVACMSGTIGGSCIEKDLTCVLNGTPCCSPYSCKGKFPNTTCR